MPKLPSLKRTKKNQKRKQKERKKNATPLERRWGNPFREDDFDCKDTQSFSSLQQRDRKRGTNDYFRPPN
jgi:hypothetical protein